jgi:ABC-type branched-subunit amino acid transport system ATPase component/branched-subunit amino acid ABC-type transport system permease component
MFEGDSSSEKSEEEGWNDVDHVGSLLLGLGNGAVFAALALALVLTYRSSGVINFATGAIAMFSAYTYASLRKGQMLLYLPGLPRHVDIGGKLDFAPAAAIALALTALLGAVLYLVVFRPLRDAPPLARAVASLGVMVVIQSGMAIMVGSAPVAVKAIFPAKRWEWGSLAILSDRFYLAVTIVVVTIVLSLVFRFTRFGLFTRASAESQTGAFVSGVSPDRVALVNWMISAAVAGLAGILIAPISPLTPISYTLFVIPALAAALVGSFQYLVPTVLAGLAIGMLQAEAINLSSTYSWLPKTGSSELVPLIIILIALTVTGQAMPARGGLLRQPLGRAPRPRTVLLPAVVGFAVGALALVVTSGTWRNAVIGTFIAAVIGLSFVVVTGYAGQVSLAQLALAGAGAYTLSFVTVSWGIPFPIAPLLAALFATGIGVVISIPALRLRGLTLGVVTLAFAYAIEAVWFRNTQIVDARGATVPSPKLFGMELGPGIGKAFPRVSFGLVCLITLVLVASGVALLRRSSLGSAMLAVRANERSAAGLGVNVTRVKVLAFAIASFIAGLGGCLLAYSRGTVTFDSFLAVSGLILISTAYLAGVTSVWGGILAGVLASTGIVFIAVDRWVHLGDWFTVITGIGVILTIIMNPEGLAAGGHALAARLPLPLFGRRRPAEVAPVEPAPVVAPTPAAEPILTVRDLHVRYGGVVAVDEVTLEVRPGQVVGLIGPNGAGKTSVIDAITGFARSTGDIEVSGVSLEGLAPHARVRKGLVRTFQAIELYDDLSVEENVSVAAFAATVGERASSVSRALALVGIEDLRDRPAGDLSQGQRQLVSIARACAAQPSVLLLDEPAAGLDSSESQWLGERIRSIADTGTGVLLVDHDVALVLGLCDHIYVLDFGRLIAAGDAAAIRADQAVAEAYLGSTHDGAEGHETLEPVLEGPPTSSSGEVRE